MKIGIVDVGGGLRGIYAAGILDYCMDNNIQFDLGIGVSAGSANLASYAASQRGRNYKFYTEYAFRKQYMGVGNFITKKSFIDMDYVYGTLCNANGEYPLDYQAFQNNSMELYVVATNAETGQAKYFDKTDIRQDHYDVLKASCAIPFVCKPYAVNNILYFDGALSNPIPFLKAFELGCERVIVILTKPVNTIRNSKIDEKLAAKIRKKYPDAADNFCKRAHRYNESVILAKEYEKQGRVLIVAPDDTCGVDTLKKSKKALKKLYEKGLRDGEKITEYLKRFSKNQ